MKGLLSTRASRAWLVVALVGLIVVVLVPALGLGGRLGSGQDLIDTARPALTDERVAGDRAGIDFISRYVDLLGPLMTERGRGSGEIDDLVALVAKRTKLSRGQVAAALRREAPHTEALLRALPFSAIASEIPRLTRYLARLLNTTEEDLAAQFEQSFPRLSQTLTALPIVTSGWNDIPGMAGMTRFDGTKEVRSVAQLRAYFSKDLVAAVERNKEDFQSVAGRGGIGYIPWLLLAAGALLLLLGLVQIRSSRDAPPGKPAWGVVVGVGVVVIALVAILQYFPRLDGAERVLGDIDPAFAQARIQGDRAGVDMLHQTVLFGDPIATKRAGAAAEVPELLTFVARQTGTSRTKVLAGLRRRAPRTTALMQAIPLSAVAHEVPHLLTYLGRRMKLSRAELLAALQKRTPRLAQSILTVRRVAIRWNTIPGTDELTRFDGSSVRTMRTLDAYFGEDVIPVLESQRQNFRDLADPWPPLTVFPPLLLGVGVFLALYGLVGMRFTTKADRRA